VAVCSGPVSNDFEVASLVSTDANRWSATGQPTLYVAGDAGVGLAEVGRHWREGFAGIGLWQVQLALDAAVDLAPVLNRDGRREHNDVATTTYMGQSLSGSVES
jgi:hypothetical protein